MRQELRHMQRELGITFVHVTHTQLEAIALADLVVVMEKGKIRQAGPARDVYASPKDRYVAEFLGGQNVLVGPGPIGQRSPCRDGGAAGTGITRAADAGRPRRQRRRDRLAVRRDDVDLSDPAPPAADGTASVRDGKS